MVNYNLAKKCRICSSKNLELILDLGKQPPANSLLDENQLENSEVKFPLRLFWCKDCFLVQLLDVVSKEDLFKHYFYMTSASKPIVDHFKKYAIDIFNEFLSEQENPFVVEIGSNDGSLLREFKKLGSSILGIEPASNLAKLANESNVTTLNDFFSLDIAKNIAQSKNVSVVVANNVIGHVENLHDLINGIKILIGEQGIFIFEVPYLLDLVKKLEFDTVYHEHLSYFSILPIINLIDRFDLEVFDIQKQHVHGGTIRIFVSKKNNFKIKENVQKFIKLEYEFGINNIKTYEKFSDDVQNLKNKIVEILQKLKKEKKSLFGYGASAKGNVLLNYCNIDFNILDYIIDTTPLKQGKFTPGTHIPILSSEKIIDKGNNDVGLLLAWNYEFEILKKEKNFRSKGGKFLIPIPIPILK
jgi:D-mycarose 3-C-methyltransferase